jgi:L-ribulose-5-phosphate 3-epimerase
VSGFPTIAVNTVTYLPYSLDEALQGIRAAGFRNVEIASIPGVCQHIPLEMDDTATDTLKRKLAGLDLQLCSLSSHTDLTSKKGAGLAMQAINLASRLEVRIVNTAVGGPSNENEDESLFLENIPEIADFARQNCVVLALEIHGTLTATGRKSIDLVRKVNHPNVKINYDTGNSLYFADTSPYEDLMEALPEVAHIHLKDKIGGKGVWNFPPIGTGEINFRRILDSLSAANFSGPISVEIEFTDKGWPSLSEVDEAVIVAFRNLVPLLKTAE